MKKILLAAVLLAPALSFAQATTTPATTATLQIDCVKASLDKRENAIITAHDAFGVAIKSALQKRLEALKSAWSETERKNRQAKKMDAWKAFKVDAQAAHTALRSARNTSWKTFDADMKVCGIKGHGEAPSQISAPNVAL